MVTGYQNKTVYLLGEHLSHSYSVPIHALLADYSYRLQELQPDAVGDFLQRGDFDALNVTIPYKQTVLPYLHHIDPAAREIGAVNTIVRRADGLYGYNTDPYGFCRMLASAGIDPSGKKAVVLGTGGASKTAVASLRQLGAAEIIVVSRTGENHYGNLEKHADARLLINTTPVGMFPYGGIAPVNPSVFPQLEAVADLIYNPCRTKLLCDARGLSLTAVNGLTMLVAQAKRACEIFTDTQIPDTETDAITRRIAFDKTNIVLIGMPGCGKSTAAAALAKRLHRPLLDTDTLVEEEAGCTVPALLEKFGEEHFRQLEHEAVKKAAAFSGYVLATGGGVVTRPENYLPLHANGSLVFLQRAPQALPADGRPLTQKNGIEKLYRERLPLYKQFADTSIEVADTPQETASRILTALEAL